MDTFGSSHSTTMTPHQSRNKEATLTGWKASHFLPSTQRRALLQPSLPVAQEQPFRPRFLPLPTHRTEAARCRTAFHSRHTQADNISGKQPENSCTGKDWSCHCPSSSAAEETLTHRPQGLEGSISDQISTSPFYRVLSMRKRTGN